MNKQGRLRALSEAANQSERCGSKQIEREQPGRGRRRGAPYVKITAEDMCETAAHLPSETVTMVAVAGVNNITPFFSLIFSTHLPLKQSPLQRVCVKLSQKDTGTHTGSGTSFCPVAPWHGILQRKCGFLPLVIVTRRRLC